MNPDSQKILRQFLMVLVVITGLAGFVTLRDKRAEIKGAVERVATVVETKQENRIEEAEAYIVYTPQMQFKDHRGQEQILPLYLELDADEVPEIGSQMDVLYVPKSNKLILNSLLSIYGRGVFWISFFLLCLVSWLLLRTVFYLPLVPKSEEL